MLSKWISIYQNLNRRNRIEMTSAIYQCLVYRKHQRMFSKFSLIQLSHSVLNLLLVYLILRKYK